MSDLRHIAEILDDPRRRAELFNAFPTLVWCADGRGGCSFVNQAWEDYTGRNSDRELGACWLESVHADDRAALERHWSEAVGLRRAFEFEYRLRRADGEYGWIHHSAVPVSDSAGRLAGFIGTCNDITEQRAAELTARAREREIRDSEERLRKFAGATHEGIVFNEGGVLTDCNDAFVQLIGHEFGEIVGTEIMQYVAPDCHETVLGHIRSGYERPYESVILHKDGTRIPVEIEGRTMPYKGTTYRLAVVKDIRRRKASQARIDYLAHYDMLTGLPNRALLLDRLDFILASARRREAQVGVLFIDLDHFKRVNDSLGHLAGDELLKVVAKRILSSLRMVDVVSRHGGDEFLVVLPDLESEQGPVPVAEKLLAAISEPVELDGQSLVVSPSIGISVFPRDGTTTDALIKNADAAMYLAKERGRSNYQFFNQNLAEAAFRALSLETLLREALAAKAFRLHYQPQVRVDNGAVTGVEALIRWPQAEGGWIEPAEFIPVAEQRGLIRAIGSWVLLEACRQNRAWQYEGLAPLPIAVNLSAVQFRQRDFVDEVAAALGATGLDAPYLAFELTEGMLMEDSVDVVRTLDGLKSLGVKLVIDDFGTGHSSLVTLKRFPIDKLKIDRTFVRDTPGDPDDVAISAAVIDLARNMGITSIAEGVDRREQLEFLRHRGCDEAQGYLFCKALPPEDIAAWLARPHTGTITSTQTG